MKKDLKKHIQEIVKSKPNSNKLNEKICFTLKYFRSNLIRPKESISRKTTNKPGKNLVKKKGGRENLKSVFIDTITYRH